MLPDVHQKAAQTRKRIRKKIPYDGDVPEVDLNARYTFRITTFYSVVDILETEMRRRRDVYKEVEDGLIFQAICQKYIVKN